MLKCTVDPSSNDLCLRGLTAKTNKKRAGLLSVSQRLIVSATDARDICDLPIAGSHFGTSFLTSEVSFEGRGNGMCASFDSEFNLLSLAELKGLLSRMISSEFR